MNTTKADRRTRAVFVGFGAFVMLVLGYLIWDLAAHQVEVRIRGEQGAQAHLDFAREQVERRCTRLEAEALWECVYGEITTARDHARAEQDLDAQQDMALFTRIMGITSIVGLTIGGFTTWLILETLWATQANIAISREIGEAQVRAYLTVQKVEFRREWTGWQLRMEIANAGQSPALDCRYNIAAALKTLEWREELRVAGKEIGREASKIPVAFETVRPGLHVSVGPHSFSMPDIKDPVEIEKSIYTTLRLEITLQYRTVFGAVSDDIPFIAAFNLSPDMLDLWKEFDWQEMSVVSIAPSTSQPIPQDA